MRQISLSDLCDFQGHDIILLNGNSSFAKGKYYHHNDLLWQFVLKQYKIKTDIFVKRLKESGLNFTSTHDNYCFYPYGVLLKDKAKIGLFQITDWFYNNHNLEIIKYSIQYLSKISNDFSFTDRRFDLFIEDKRLLDLYKNLPDNVYVWTN